MTSNLAIKQLEERNVPNEIVLMVWSDRMDLVALANIKGEVALHRLAWSRAWTLGPPRENLQVKAMCWRPDGKFIAIAYSSGKTLLVKVENRAILNSFELKSDEKLIKSEVTFMSWMQNRNGKTKTSEERTKQREYVDTFDQSINFIPEYNPHLSFAAACNRDVKDIALQDQSHLNLLLTGTSDGLVEIRVFGRLLCASINVGLRCSITHLHLNEDLRKLYITYTDPENNVKVALYNTQSIFHTHISELFSLALKYVKITLLQLNLTGTITTVTESWESILLEMDNKLSKYASKVPPGGVSADFLDLLTFGFCSNAMKYFLIHDLTIKGLEKIGQTIEMSYSNIQKLMLKYATKYAQNIMYHLAELRGMSRLVTSYKILGLEENLVDEAVQSVGAFLIKGVEMQQIINQSIINYQAFFRWMYIAIMHVLEEQIPTEVPRMTQQDLSYITEFILNFDTIGSRNVRKSGFMMERLGQYLSDAPLTIPPDMCNNEWSSFLESNKCLKENKAMFQHFREMSLIQQYNHLNRSIERIFAQVKEPISKELSLVRTFNCFEHIGPIRSSQFSTSKDSTICVFLQPPHKIHTLYFQEDRVLAGSLHFSADQSDFDVLDVELYSPTMLSCLLQDAKKLTSLYQIPLMSPLEQLVDIRVDQRVFDNAISINCFNVIPKLHQPIEGMVAVQFAVSGARKVGIVLAENRRKIRLYEMEGEEEEEEDAEMTNSFVTDIVDSEMKSSKDFN